MVSYSRLDSLLWLLEWLEILSGEWPTKPKNYQSDELQRLTNFLWKRIDSIFIHPAHPITYEFCY